METTPCPFVTAVIIIISYVDDLFLFARDETIIEEQKAELSKQFCLMNSEQSRQMLGIDVNRKYEGSL